MPREWGGRDSGGVISATGPSSKSETYDVPEHERFHTGDRRSESYPLDRSPSDGGHTPLRGVDWRDSLTTTLLPLPTVDPATLYAAHHEALLRYLVRFTGDADDAADAAQETYLKLMANPPATDQNPRAWLFTVASNLVRDSWRRRQSQKRLEEMAETDLMGQAAPEPDVQVERDDERRRARQALDRLSDKERTVLLMREEGFTHREIAEAVETTTKSVGTMIARALKKFSQALSPVPEGPTP